MRQVIVAERGECMKVGELIQLLQAFDPEMKVLMTRSDTGLEDVVACYDDLVCQGRVAGYDQLDEYVFLKGADASTAEKVIVIDMCEPLEDCSKKQ
ncbi:MULTISPECIES: hypothetical protein [Pseudomonas]|uniref:hypothetical protein n=1 Tax=Pseudomonas TaxID=286 RepID=UPI0011824DC8|nr:hypothetical protein [Pseudomonas sp. BJP69]QDR68465.1 hypothetical protein FPB55_12835 [Pseudomonas sp. BJP69]WHL27062.1 hypothetical protein QJS63_21120 [Pseudomonas juntendi]